MNACWVDFESLPYRRSGIMTANDLQKTRYSLYSGHTDILLTSEKKITSKKSLKNHRKTLLNFM